MKESFKKFIQRFALFTKRLQMRNSKRKNPDWSRIDEPDTFLQPFVLLMFTLAITAFAGMVNFAFAEPGSLETSIAEFLTPYVTAGRPFYQVYGAFTFALLAIVEAAAYMFIAIMGEPDHHGIVGMIDDLDVNTQDRIAELDKDLQDRLDQISAQVSDIQAMSIIPDPVEENTVPE